MWTWKYVPQWDGVDLVMRTATTLYVVELKLNQSAEAAMQQIDLKNYPERFALCGLPVVKVGINFDMERHTLKDWVIERLIIKSGGFIAGGEWLWNRKQDFTR